jgi:hypothetical protein
MSRMKTASILLASFVGLGFCREAGAWEAMAECKNYLIEINNHQYGVCEGFELTEDATINWEKRITVLVLGNLGTFELPFTATYGLIGFCCILATLIFLPVVLTMRWKRKRRVSE